MYLGSERLDGFPNPGCGAEKYAICEKLENSCEPKHAHQSRSLYGLHRESSHAIMDLLWSNTPNHVHYFASSQQLPQALLQVKHPLEIRFFNYRNHNFRASIFCFPVRKTTSSLQTKKEWPFYTSDKCYSKDISRIRRCSGLVVATTWPVLSHKSDPREEIAPRHSAKG